MSITTSTASSLAVIALTLLFPLQGSTDTLERYASELPIASTPGPGVKRWVGRTAGPPDKRLATLYTEMLRRWEYVADPPGQDHFQPAEPLLLRGDCEDFASVLTAACRVLGITCQVVLAESSEKKGHVWAEVLISRETKLNGRLYRRIKASLGQRGRIISRKGGHWVQLDPEGLLERYHPKYIITVSGELLPLSVTAGAP